jgi:DNA-binding transcriptional LysR family regulator
MSPDDLNWELCRSFLVVLREGSLSRAARALRLTQPTLGRHIDEIEAKLSSALFVRSPRGLLPTEAAFELRPHAEAMAAAADALVRAASGGGGEARGTVRLTVPELMGFEILPPILADFRQKYPRVVVELALTNRTEDLLRRDADIAVRGGRPTQDALIARRIGDIDIGLYAHRDYLARHAAPKTLDALYDHTLIGFDKDSTAIQALRNAGPPVSRDNFAFRSDSTLAQLAMVRAGYGIGGCSTAIARRDPSLVRVLPDQFKAILGIWVIMHEDQRGSRRIRLMFDHLARALSSNLASATKK